MGGINKFEFISHAEYPNDEKTYTVVFSETCIQVADILFGDTEQGSYNMAHTVAESLSATDGIKSPVDAIQMIREWAQQIKAGNSFTITPTNTFGIELLHHFGA